MYIPLGRHDEAHVSPIPPPRRPRTWIEVRRASPTESPWGVCLLQEVIPVWCHWHSPASGKVRCIGKGCPWCEQMKDAPRWYAYMLVLNRYTGKIDCLEITFAAATDCPQMNGKRIPLRGKKLTLGRHGASSHGRCWARIEEFTGAVALPPPLDPVELLDMIFQKAESVPFIVNPAKWEGE